MVEFINSQRGVGDAVLRHDNFMKKVPIVLGEAAPKFLGTATYDNGTGGKVTRNVYQFLKREACLMAMSYSYELQAKVFDRMTELEGQKVAPQVPQSLPEALRLASDLAEQNVKQAILIEQQKPASASQFHP
jgi:hypothetical protein